ncbi:glutamate/aspartate transport system permease protein [Mesorhizobium robiniae]|uniref:Glutamate/aspartate transport system permease protein n=1 Tax=Mesorhizobium robiniae TaxID=559315 RepID=A0ABV2GNM8_9HYPH
MNYRWNWGIVITEPYLGWLVSGLTWTLLVAGAAFCIAMLMGVFVGIMRTLPSRTARMVGATYVEIFRNIPLLLQLFLWYFVLPEVVPDSVGRFLKRDMPMPEYWTAVVGLGLFSASRIGEQVRAGIEAVGRGQAMATAASGLSRFQSYRYVLIPLAARNILPPMTSEFLSLIKNSSLALTIGVLELTGQSRQIESITFQGIEAFTAATAIYSSLTLIVVALMRRVEIAVAIPGTVGHG